MRDRRISLQTRVLLLIACGMGLVLTLSGYLHGLITQRLIEEDRYNAAITETVAIAERIVSQQLFSDVAALQRDIKLVAHDRSDFAQIDVYRGSSSDLHLAATTAPGASRLPPMDEHTPDNDLREMEQPVPGVVTMEIRRADGRRYWVISMTIEQRGAGGYVTSLVLKNSHSPFVNGVQFQHNLVLGGAIAVCVALVWLLFVRFFRRPARDIVRAMSLARDGNFASRAEVRRDDELGEIARGFNVMMDDLSARDRERETLLTKIGGFNEELRREVQRATAELRMVNEELLQTQQRLGRAERLAAMGQVAASLAHDIGTPLNSIAGHLQLLARRLRQDADAHRRLGIIDRQVDLIVRRVRALLRRTHKGPALLQPTDLNALIGEILRLVAPTLDAHAISLSAILDPVLPRVLADGDSLQQVFLNLINNSVDAMPSGGSLTIETRLDAHGALAEVIVRDTGPGIGPEAREHLFEPMWTTKPTGGGFGLTIAREIMTEHGGALDVDTSSTQGAMFRLFLPLAERAVTA